MGSSMLRCNARLVQLDQVMAMHQQLNTVRASLGQRAGEWRDLDDSGAGADIVEHLRARCPTAQPMSPCHAPFVSTCAPTRTRYTALEERLLSLGPTVARSKQHMLSTRTTTPYPSQFEKAV